jgi:hypothetical protein
MRTAKFVVLALIGLVLGSAEAQAYDSGPVIVVPGRHGRPVIINGVDVTGAVIEGDWGLYRPHMVNPTIIAAPVFIPRRIYQGGYGNDRVGSDEGGYFPSLGREPGYGRREIEPPADRPLPPPARRFHRSWSTASEPLPVNLDPPTPVNVSPEIYPGGRRGNNARPKKTVDRKTDDRESR